MFGVDKKYLTISINEGLIKVAQASSSGSVERVARGTYNVIPGGADAIKNLKLLLGPFNRSAPVLCVVPASAATAKCIEVPSSDPEEIKSIINLQASRHTPYSREEVLISYINLGLSIANNTRLLLVIVHRDLIKERISVLEKSGLNVDKILFVPEAVARFYSKALGAKKSLAPIGIIDFSINSTSYIVPTRGSLQFVRNIPIGIKTIVQGGDVSAKLLDEIKKSMDAYMQENGSDAPRSYMVTTSHEAVKNILPILKQGLNIDIQVNAFSTFVKGSRDVLKKLQGEFADDSFLDVLAPASAAVRCEINLMPQEMVLKKTVERQSQEAIKTGIAAVIMMMLVIAMIMSKIYFKDAFLNKNLREHYAPQRAQVAILQEQMNKAKVVRSFLLSRMVSLDIIHELYTITPHSIYLNNISVDDEGTITIDGISESMSQVFSYVKSIDDSSLFKDAKTKSTSTKKDNGKDVAAFEIEFKLNDSKDPGAIEGPKSGGTPA